MQAAIERKNIDKTQIVSWINSSLDWTLSGLSGLSMDFNMVSPDCCSLVPGMVKKMGTRNSITFKCTVSVDGYNY